MKKQFSWISPLIEARSSKTSGNGVFAKKNIPKHTLLAIFGGYILTKNEERKLPLSIRDNGIQIERNFVIALRSPNEFSPSDYINHSCEPNAGIRGQISLYSISDINAKEEISFDYGTVLFGTQKKPTYKLKCNCGSQSCRGVITDHDWLLPHLHKRLMGYIPYYILDEIKKMNAK